jgi:hypothetical protein
MSVRCPVLMIMGASLFFPFHSWERLPLMGRPSEIVQYVVCAGTPHQGPFPSPENRFSADFCSLSRFSGLWFPQPLTEGFHGDDQQGQSPEQGSGFLPFVMLQGQDQGAYRCLRPLPGPEWPLPAGSHPDDTGWPRPSPVPAGAADPARRPWPCRSPWLHTPGRAPVRFLPGY